MVASNTVVTWLGDGGETHDSVTCQRTLGSFSARDVNKCSAFKFEHFELQFEPKSVYPLFQNCTSTTHSRFCLDFMRDLRHPYHGSHSSRLDAKAALGSYLKLSNTGEFHEHVVIEC